MLIKHPLIYFPSIIVKNLLRKITPQPEIKHGTSRLSGASVLATSNTEACDGICKI